MCIKHLQVDKVLEFVRDLSVIKLYSFMGLKTRQSCMFSINFTEMFQEMGFKGTVLAQGYKLL